MLTRLNVAGRLDRLAHVWTPTGCAICAGWSEIALGDDAGNPDRPTVCPGCGRVVPVRTLVCILGVPMEAP